MTSMDVTATPRQVLDPEACPPIPNEPEDKRVPEQARLWGFVRRTANEKDDSASLRETDVGLWLDEQCYRFLVTAGRSVKDNLAPLEFIQFIRELKHSRSQTLFKLGNSFQPSPRRATAVWSRPVAAVIYFPAKLRLAVKGAAKHDRAGTERQRNSDSTGVVMPAARRINPPAPRRRFGNAMAASLS